MTIANSIVIADNAYGTIGSGLAVGDTTLAFTTGHGARFPVVAAGQILSCCLLNSNNVLEEINITAHTSGSDSATISRAANSTSAKIWTAGDRIEARVSSDVLRRIQQDAQVATSITTADAGATYTGTLAPAPLDYVTGMIYNLTLTTTNSGANPTIALNSLAAKTVKLDDGTALVASQMPLNGLYKFDGTNLILMNPTNSSSAATQAQMEAAASTAVFSSPARQQFHPSAAKAWLQCDVAGNIDISYNITSITDNGAGDLTVTIATDFSSANYTVNATVSSTNQLLCANEDFATPKAAGVCRLKCYSNVNVFTDPTGTGKWFINFFGDQ